MVVYTRGAITVRSATAAIKVPNILTFGLRARVPESQKLKTVSQPGIESLSQCPRTATLGKNGLRCDRIEL